jgi:hypothetical protein
LLGLFGETLGKVERLVDDRRPGDVMAHVVQDRPLGARGDDRIGNAFDPDTGAAAVTALALSERLEGVDLVGARVLAEAEEDHPSRSRHARIIASWRRRARRPCYWLRRWSRSAASFWSSSRRRSSNSRNSRSRFSRSASSSGFIFRFFAIAFLLQPPPDLTNILANVRDREQRSGQLLSR